MKKTISILLVLSLLVSVIMPMAVLAEPVASVESLTTTQYGDWWSHYHMTSEGEANAGTKGGEGGQMIWALAVAPSDPTKLMMGTDTGAMMVSTDSGATWYFPENKGFLPQALHPRVVAFEIREFQFFVRLGLNV